MEYIERIFYRKINPSDFKKLYDIDKPEGGGGQTYLEAAGISNEKIVDFLSCAEISDSPLKKKGETRFVYTFNAYILGQSKDNSSFIEFAPRSGRNNYRISRQNMKYKHPAWSINNGFPEANKDANGTYTSEGNFEGIIDNLVIWIIRTSYNKYYAGFVNENTMPEEWPHDIGLEEIFEDERRGVIDTERAKLQFINNKKCPFGTYSTMSVEEERVSTGENILLYGVPGSGKSWTIEHEYCKKGSVVERLVFHPDYTYSDFIGQILPAVADDGQVSYKFTPGPFTNILREAYNNPKKEYILVIEEINRGNAPAIFGEVFQLLDRKVEIQGIDDDGYPVGTSEYGITNENIAEEMYGNNRKNEKIRIPSNLSIIGTMNTSDQNVFTLDTAFQRRWDMRLIENDFENVNSTLANAKILDTGVTWKNFCIEINNIIIGNSTRMTSAEDKRLGAYFVHLRDLKFNESMGDLKVYDVLRKKESKGTLTDDEKIQITVIRDAMRQNRKFPEKVIKYLWDDAFKFNREIIFDVTEYQSLEQVIHAFMYAKGLDRFKIFKDNVKDAFISNDEE
ncbi:AAA family ATPase [Peptacetobacter hiranonis]|uniref:AAA family ATPase n=1 Tax=Peptacetobacter hiranonis TaxID=89152 RepID=UPI002E78BF67|nr:AAA family ATPase [Peptacetobacter hiranonis]MEE0248525.1 AAA family ATPase [Peptacetobacter hiranonis]